MDGKVIAVIGAGMIGAAHAVGYRAYLPRIKGLSARLDAVFDANTDLATKLMDNWGFERVATDWRAVIDDSRIRYNCTASLAESADRL
jgi:predicted dehydrogenase